MKHIIELAVRGLTVMIDVNVYQGCIDRTSLYVYMDWWIANK